MIPCKSNWQICLPVHWSSLIPARSSTALACIYVSRIFSAMPIISSSLIVYATFVPIYGVSITIVAPSLYIGPVQITQSYEGDCPANTVDCLILQIQSAKTYDRRSHANPNDKYACQCILGPCLWLGTPLHWLTYLSVRFAQHCRLYWLCYRICNICANLLY